MRGALMGKDVPRHSLTIVKAWGLRGHLRCLRAGLSRRPSTFLAVPYGAPAQGGSDLREMVDRLGPPAATPIGGGLGGGRLTWA